MRIIEIYKTGDSVLKIINRNKACPSVEQPPGKYAKPAFYLIKPSGDKVEHMGV